LDVFVGIALVITYLKFGFVRNVHEVFKVYVAFRRMKLMVFCRWWWKVKEGDER